MAPCPEAAVEKAAGGESSQRGVDPAKGLSPHRSPVSPPPVLPGGAAARHPSGLDALEILGRALQVEYSWGLATVTDGRAADEAGSPVARAGGRVPLRGSPVSHWLPAVSLGTWRRRRRRPPSGWARDRGPSRWTERRGVEGAGGPLDP